MVSVNFLEKVGLFQGLEPNDLSQIEPWCSEKEYKRDEKIFSGGKRLGGGDPANQLYILTEGAVELRFDISLRETDKEMKVDSVKPGQAFGWSSMVPPYRYTLSAYCSSDTLKLIELRRDVLTRIFNNNNRIGYLMMNNMTKMIAKRFFRLQEEYVKHAGEGMMGW